MSSSINPQNNRDLNQGIMHLVVQAWTDDELLRTQAQNGVNFDFKGKFDLEGKRQSPLKTIGSVTKVFYIYGSNLVILAWTGLELSRGQASDRHTAGQTDRGNDNNRWPYWPRVKMQKSSIACIAN